VENGKPSRRETVADYLADLRDRVENGKPSRRQEGLLKYFKALAYRLESVDLLHGDWTRCLGKGVLNRGRNKNKSVGVFFDPPYRRDCCESERLYAHSGDVAAEVEEWCREHTHESYLRICLAGYEGSVHLPGWSKYAWTNSGGARGKRDRERLWFSPHCLR
jgi:hypothetical protein